MDEHLAGTELRSLRPLKLRTFVKMAGGLTSQSSERKKRCLSRIISEISYPNIRKSDLQIRSKWSLVNLSSFQLPLNRLLNENENWNRETQFEMAINFTFSIENNVWHQSALITIWVSLTLHNEEIAVNLLLLHPWFQIGWNACVRASLCVPCTYQIAPSGSENSSRHRLIPTHKTRS